MFINILEMYLKMSIETQIFIMRYFHVQQMDAGSTIKPQSCALIFGPKALFFGPKKY